MPSVAYDDNASSFFFITILLLFTVPSGIYILLKVWRWSPATAKRHVARTAAEAEKAALLATRDAVVVLWTPALRALTWVTGFAFALTIILVIIALRTPSLAAYDPYEILGLAVAASEKEIRSAYRKLSLIYHPDKAGGNAELFQKIAKAYEALIDPEARANWEKFGNPDGKQALEVALGLPSVLLHPQGKYVFLVGYILILLSAVPWVMRRVYAQSNVTPEGDCGMHPATNQWFAMTMEPSPDLGRLPTIFGGMFEAAPTPKDPAWEGPQAAELRDEYTSMSSPPAGIRRFMDPQATYSKTVIPNDTIMANSTLLHAHLYRRPIRDPLLRAHLTNLLSRLEGGVNNAVFYAFVNTARAYAARDSGQNRTARPMLLAVSTWLEFSARVTQAVGLKDAMQRVPVDFRQVFDEAQWERLRAAGRCPKTLASFIAMPRAGRTAVLRDAVTAGDAKELEALETVVRDLPQLEGSARAFIDGAADDSPIVEGDFVTIRIPVRHANLLREGEVLPVPKPMQPEGYGPDVPEVFAPHFPHPRAEEWHVWVEDSASGRFIWPTHQQWRPTRACDVIELRIQAGKPGPRMYRIHFLSSVYLGLDVIFEASADVRPRTDAPDAEDGDEEFDEGDKEILGGADMAMESMLFGAKDDLSDCSDEEEEEEEEGGEGGEGGKAKKRGGKDVDSDFDEPILRKGGKSKGGASAPVPAAAAAAAGSAASPVASGGAAAVASTTKGGRLPAAAEPEEEGDGFGGLKKGRGKAAGGKGSKGSSASMASPVAAAAAPAEAAAAVAAAVVEADLD